MRGWVFVLTMALMASAAAAADTIQIGAGLWPCQMFRLKAGDRLTSVLRPGSGPLLCYTRRAMEQYEAIDTDEDELSDIVEKKEKHLVESGRCQVFVQDVPYRVTDDAYHVLTLIREDMPKTELYYRKPVQMAHPCE